LTVVLLIDDAKGATELFAAALENQLGVDVRPCFDAGMVTGGFAREVAADLALVDLSPPGQAPRNGADALLVLAETSPATVLAVLTRGDPGVHDLLREVWGVLPISGMISRSSSVERQLSMVARLLDGESPVVDDELVRFTTENSTSRSLAGYARLVGHAGHAKLWRGLMDLEHPPTYGELAARTGLAVNSLRNYRSQVLPELRLHGLVDPSLRDIHAFARRSRPFLRPHVDARLD